MNSLVLLKKVKLILLFQQVSWNSICAGRQSTIIQESNPRAEANILRNNPLVESVEMEFPNKHYFDVDFSKFPEVQGLNETDHHRVYIAGGMN